MVPASGKSADLKRLPCAVVVAILVCAAIGVALIDCLTHPDDAGSVGRSAPQQEPGSPAASHTVPPPHGQVEPVTPEQLVAEARQLADRLIEAFPDSPQALTLGGRIYYAFGDEPSARQCWERSLQLDPEFAATWHVIGEAAWERGDYAGAAEQLRKAIEADPRLHAKLAFALADSLLNSGRAEDAVAVLEPPADKGPLSLDGLLLVGHAYAQLAQYEKAKDRFEAALALDPRSSKAHFGLATIYARLQRPEQANKHRQEYAELKKQDFANTERLRGSLRNTDLGNVRPLAGRCHLNAGKVYALNGNLVEAEKLWLRAAALDPRNPEPRTLLGLMYSEQGRAEEAVRIQQAGDLGGPPGQGM